MCIAACVNKGLSTHRFSNLPVADAPLFEYMHMPAPSLLVFVMFNAPPVEADADEFVGFIFKVLVVISTPYEPFFIPTVVPSSVIIESVTVLLSLIFGIFPAVAVPSIVPVPDPEPPPPYDVQ
jgi:hypothetical protein